ncbi:MAG: hypothetical protein QM523_07325 [Candidatus Pacebacteria bacterium]|nr:hypothetical protein [Candidatus Paceibacterota bacterium]
MGVIERAVKHSINFMIVSGGEMPAALQIVENFFNNTQKLVENFSLNNLIWNRSGRACASRIGCRQTAFCFYFLFFVILILVPYRKTHSPT